jgi:hypothetical protein
VIASLQRTSDPVSPRAPTCRRGQGTGVSNQCSRQLFLEPTYTYRPSGHFFLHVAHKRPAEPSRSLRSPRRSLPQRAPRRPTAPAACYGYLPNPANANGLPVGFTASGAAGSQFAGMTCPACHTRQIIAKGKTYRIDGGPAIVHFQSFLTDLDTAVGRPSGASSAVMCRCGAGGRHAGPGR